MRLRQLITWIVFLGLVAACSQSIETYTIIPATPTPPPEPSATQTQFRLSPPVLTATQTPEQAPSATPKPVSVWIDPAVPAAFTTAMTLPPGLVFTESDQADIRVKIGLPPHESAWIYIAAAAFPSLREAVDSESLSTSWSAGEPDVQSGLHLIVSPETEKAFSILWGEPSSGSVTVMPESELISAAWDERDAVAILPFEALEPRWKVLSVDGQTPFDKDFNLTQYPLTLPITLESRPDLPGDFDLEALNLPYSNFQADLLSSVALTGVTALVRGTALTMKAKGITYPAEDIQPWLVETDILHINNEIPFYKDCPPPELYPTEIRFCSPPEYVELLTFIGTDIIELAGDHFGDFGADAMYETIELYQDLGIPFYGGGATSLEARQAVLLEHNGNQFAFIGCNAKGITFYASATESAPGAVACDFDWLVPEVKRLTNAGYIVIATFQHNEYYTYEAQPDLKRDFKLLADAGAVIVSGSQAHQPHGMEFYAGSFLHYGLGNLFFDQYRYFPGPELDRAFIDRHYFYAGHYISTQLLTIQFVDLARSRPTTPEEREIFLKKIFEASGW